ncbi:MAG: hypothetical protein IT193_20190 [Propionibacteriaceae bacterium]|nr:hypothetical protein [Propionibacteriaceae bacterium]
MDELALKGVVPGLMAAHPEFGWEFVDTTRAFAIVIRPLADRRRYATVEVWESAEIFSYAFAGHESVDFAYETSEKEEVLQEQIEQATRALRGPTRVMLDWAGDKVARSMITHDFGGEDSHDFTMDRAVERLLWWLKGKRLRREIVRFPALPTP